MTNSGVGPARIESMRLRIRGDAATNWDAALPPLVEGPAPRFGQMAIVGRVLRPGESVDLLSTSDPRLVAVLHDIVVTGDGAIDYCYCSSFDECWLANISSDITRPEPVDRCPDFAPERFVN